MLVIGHVEPFEGFLSLSEGGIDKGHLVSAYPFFL
jgi:hypothetical protein